MVAVRLLLCLLGSCLLLPAMAQAPPSDSDLSGDTRLSRKISVQAEGLPVGELLERIAREANVTLSAKSDTADDKVIVFSKARTIRDTLHDLAHLLHARWQVEETPKGRRYALGKSIAAERYEARLIKERTEQARNSVEELVKALPESPEQLAERPPTDPVRKQLSNSQCRQGLKFYSFLNAQQKEQLFDSNRLRIPFELFTSSQQEQLRLALIADHKKAGYDPADLTEDLEAMKKHGLQFAMVHTEGYLSIGLYLGIMSNLPVANLNPRGEWLLPVQGNPYSREAVPETASFPSVAAIAAASQQSHLCDRLRILAEKSGVPVFADYYRFFRGTKPSKVAASNSIVPVDGKGESLPVADLLDSFCQEPGLLWWIQDKTLYFRYRDWYMRRLSELPDRWVMAMAKRLQAQKGTPTFRDVAACQELTLNQLQALSDTVRTYPLYFADEELGLSELLQLIVLSPSNSARTPVPEWSGGTPTELLNAALTYGQMNTQQRLLVRAFVDKRQLMEASEDLPSFRIAVTCRPPVSMDPQKQDSPKLSVIYIHWSLNNAETRGDNSYSIPLPVVLPDDRREKTRIEMENEAAKEQVDGLAAC